MNTLRIIIVTLTFSFLAIAQQAERIEELKTRLNLSPEQVEKIQPILVEQAAKVKEIRDKHAGETSRRSKLGMARELRTVQDEMQKRIEPLLTKEQRTEWKKIREERKEDLRDELKERRGN